MGLIIQTLKLDFGIIIRINGISVWTMIMLII